MNWDLLAQYGPRMLDGLVVTIELVAISVSVGALLALPIALSRLPRSLEFLLTIVATESEPVAAAAIEALVIYRHVEAVRGRIQAAVAPRKSAKLDAAYKKNFSQ